MGSFVKVAQFSLSELDDSWKEMKQKVTTKCESKNQSIIQPVRSGSQFVSLLSVQWQSVSQSVSQSFVRTIDQYLFIVPSQSFSLNLSINQ